MARYLVAFLPGSAVPTRIKYIDDAVGPPDENVDAGTDGVSFGSILWDGTHLWFCVDATTGAAVWVGLGGPGSAGGGHLTSLDVQLSVSGAYVIDYATAATHDLTLSGDAEFTLDGALPGETTVWWLWLRPDGNDVDWSGIPVSWIGGSEPDLSGDLVLISLATTDDGASIVGTANGGGVGVHTHDTIGPILVTSVPAGSPLVFADLLQNSEGTDLLYASEP